MTRSARALLSGIVDYAGLFPPAKLDMEAAVENYARYRNGADAWLLGAFVVPVVRFDEFLQAARRHLRSEDQPWRLSAIAGGDVAAELARAGALDPGAEAGGSGVRIEAVEVKANAPGDVDAIAGALPEGMRAYIEFPPGAAPEETVKALARPRPGRAVGLRAKIRTGGLTPDAIPTVDDVARFLRLCYATNVPFKATAGLHHAVRGEHALTYEADAPRAVMHGFLNLFLAAALCFNGLGAADALRILSMESAQDWVFDDDGVRWEEYRLSAAEIETVRRRFAVSFGSCSFEEPLEDLRRLGLIG